MSEPTHNKKDGIRHKNCTTYVFSAYSNCCSLRCTNTNPILIRMVPIVPESLYDVNGVPTVYIQDIMGKVVATSAKEIQFFLCFFCCCCEFSPPVKEFQAPQPFRSYAF